MTERRDLRVSDGERAAVAERLRVALDEGRLDFFEYDRRLGEAYASVTYGDLHPLVADLPATDLPGTGLAAAELRGADPVPPRRRTGASPASLRGGVRPGPVDVRHSGVVTEMHLSLRILWIVWGAVAAINLTVWLLVSLSGGDAAYFWPMWLLVPGALLAVTTVGVHRIGSGGRHHALPTGRPDADDGSAAG